MENDRPHFEQESEEEYNRRADLRMKQEARRARIEARAARTAATIARRQEHAAIRKKNIARERFGGGGGSKHVFGGLFGRSSGGKKRKRVKVRVKKKHKPKYKYKRSMKGKLGRWKW